METLNNLLKERELLLKEKEQNEEKINQLDEKIALLKERLRHYLSLSVINNHKRDVFLEQEKNFFIKKLKTREFDLIALDLRENTFQTREKLNVYEDERKELLNINVDISNKIFMIDMELNPSKTKVLRRR